MKQRHNPWGGARVVTVIGLWLATVALPARAQSPVVELQVNAFPGASNLPIWVAQREGLYARRGITVVLGSPKGSLDQFHGLVDGRYPVVVTAFDNVIAYHSGQGPAEIGAVPDLVAVMGVDRGLLSLVARPDIRRVADLKGHTLAVDALATGFSFALRDILRKAGVAESGVAFVAVGNSDGRWKALREGRADATLLTLPADLEAADQGSRVLTTMARSFGHYLGNVVAVQSGWAAGHGAALDAFLGGTQDAVSWLFDRRHRDRAIEILHAEMPGLDERALGRVYEALVHSPQGLIRDGRPDLQGARTVLALRARYATAPRPLEKIDAYLETRRPAGR